MFDVFFKAGMTTPINNCKEELMDDTKLITYGYKFLTNWRGITPIWKLIKYNDYISILRPDNTIRINTQTIEYIPFDEFRCNRNFDKDPIDDIVEKIEEIDYKYLFKSGESAGKEMLWKKSQSKGTPMVIRELLDEM